MSKYVEVGWRIRGKGDFCFQVNSNALTVAKIRKINGMYVYFVKSGYGEDFVLMKSKFKKLRDAKKAVEFWFSVKG